MDTFSESLVPSRNLQRITKRVLDLILSCVAIILSLPVQAIVAIAIRFDSPGPILFRQKRAGLNGRPFVMYKFRTMVPDAEKRLGELIDIDNLEQPVFKIQNDPRVTRVGKFLRRTSLDELPQLYNVLLGDMSMVGPRPEEMLIVSKYTTNQRRRLSVKPGITGPMQVSGRGNLPFDERLALELDYITKWSLLSDILLLLKTIPAVMSGRGAY